MTFLTASARLALAAIALASTAGGLLARHDASAETSIRKHSRAPVVAMPPETCDGDRMRVTCNGEVSALTNSTGNQVSYTVYNDAGYAETVSFTCSVSSPVASCTPPANVTILANSEAGVQLTYATGGTSGTGSVTLHATSFNYGDEIAAPTTVFVNPPPPQVSVTPDGQAHATTLSGAVQSLSFTVRNDGSQSVSLNLFPSCTGVITQCTSVTPSSMSLTSGQSASASVSFYPDSAAAGTLRLEARTMAGTALDAGQYAITVAEGLCDGDRSSLTCEWRESAALNAKDIAVTYTIHNRGPTSSFEDYIFTCRVERPVDACVAPSDTLRLTGGTSQAVTVLYSAGAKAGLGSVTLEAFSFHYGETVEGTFDVSIGGTFLRDPMSVAATGTDRQLRGVCPVIGASAGGAAQCGDLLYAHAFPAYRSLNRARSVTLLYNSGAANPKPVVAIDYLTYPNRPIGAFRVALKRITDGLQLDSVYFDTTHYDGERRQYRRFSVPLDLAIIGGGSKVHTFEVVLQRKVGPDWKPVERDTTSVLVVDRRTSPFGSGWWPAGVERLFPGQADGSALLVLGDGSAIRFALVNGEYVAPPGEHSSLTATHTGFERQLPGNRVRISYDAAGFVTSIMDVPHSLTARYAWRAGGPDGRTLESITDPVGKSITFAIGADGRVTGLAIPAVKPITLGQTNITANGADLTTITDPDGFVTQLGYAPGTRRMTASTARGTSQFTYEYDAMGRLKKATPPTGIFKTFRAWQSAGGAGTGGTPSSPAQSAPLDSAIVLASWQRAYGLGPDQIKFRVGPSGAPSEVRPPGGGPVTTIERDSAGQPIRITSTTGAEVQQAWDVNGNLLRRIQRVSGRWSSPTATYDTTSFEYDPVWLDVTKITPPSKRAVVTIGYAAQNGDREFVRDAEGRETQFGYNARGQLTHITEPHHDRLQTSEPIPTVYDYDPLTGNLVSITEGPNVTSYTYDAIAKSDLVKVTNAVGMETNVAYDDIKRPLTITTGENWLWSTVTYEYNDLLRTRKQIDPIGGTATWHHDESGRLTKRCVNGTCESTKYEDGLNPTKLELRDTTWVLQDFDAAGRITRREAMKGFDHDTITFSYDAAGNMTHIDNKYSRVRRSYDAYGRVMCERQEIRYFRLTTPRKWGAATAWYEHDRDGAIERVMRGTQPCELGPSSAGDTLVYAYNQVGALESLQSKYWNVSTEKWQWTYDGKGRTIRLDVPDKAAQYETWVYDDLDRLVRFKEHPGPRDSIVAYDALGRVLELRAFDTKTYTYDDLGRLKTSTGNGDNDTDAFTYDLAGNRLSDTTWTYDIEPTTGRLRSKALRPANDCGIRYNYDVNGNERASVLESGVCSKAVERSMTYDVTGRMVASQTKLREPTGIRTEEREFWYDGLGRRILLRSLNDSAGDKGTWRYFWFGDHVGVKTHNLNDTTPDPYGTAFVDLSWPLLDRTYGSHGEWFLYGPGVDNVLGSLFFNTNKPSPNRLLFHRSYRGSVRAVSDTSGSDLNLGSGQYGPFGQGSPQASPGYNGAEAAGDLVYMRNRWYDPNNGRFTQEDPIGFAGGINLYAYAGNDPLTFSDPFGLKVCFKGQDKQRLADSTAAATGTTFSLDASDCAENVQAVGGKWNDVSRGFAELAADTGWVVNMAYGIGGSRVDANGITIDLAQVGNPYGTRRVSGGCTTSSGANYDEVSIIAHEVGHAYAGFKGYSTSKDTRTAMRWENRINRARGRPSRSVLCH